MVIEEIAKSRFPYPSAEEPNFEVTLNVPARLLGVQLKGGGWLYPDIAVTEEPGHFLRMSGEVVLPHEVTQEVAVERWAPLAKAAGLYLFVPAGHAGRAARLCRQHRIPLAGLRTWRHRVSFGVDVQEAYSGPDLFAPIAALLPPIMRPRAYREERQTIVGAYLVPPPAGRIGEIAPPASSELPALPAGSEHEARADHGEAHGNAAHLPPPSWAPLMMAAGMILTGFGAIFPAELLGVGIVVTTVGVLRWFLEDLGYFEAGGPAEAREEDIGVLPGAPEAPEGIHMPPPSLSPIMFALGMILLGFGVIFPAELLGAGITLTALGGLSWWVEDLKSFEEGDHHEAAGHAGADEAA